MTLLSVLERLLIRPLKIVFEVIFDYADQFTGHPGLAIVVLSLAMNILVLPLYRSADKMQEAARDREDALRPGASHIKAVFSGDERMMILQTFYRQNHYSPLQALNGSVSLLLEIPFFIAAYQFLSHLEVLSGVSFGPIRDLGQPDGLLQIGSLTVNLLPLVMTAVNVLSSALYLKGFPLKSKIQLYAMAGFFLVFLYGSPSCLLVYWTLNNVFSLGKNIVYKLKRPKKEKVIPAKKKLPAPDGKLFTLGSVFLTVFIGLLIPSAYIAASPQEYIDINYFHDPTWYVVSAFCISAGTFLIWMRVFYWLAGPRWKVILERAVWVLCGAALVDYMFFGTDLGVISSALQYEEGMHFTTAEQLINMAVLCAAAVALLALVRKRPKIAHGLLIISAAALVGMSALDLFTIRQSVALVTANASEEEPGFRLSRTGKNVMVIMLDRAMGEYVPYIFNERPELAEQFSGFTYYANTISFGGHTNFAAPAMLGGYEYTPVELNRRDTEPMEDKHDEALKVMPVLFSENGYEVTVCDPPYAGYQWIPDLSIYDDCPGVRTFITEGYFGDETRKQLVIESNYRNFFCFAAMKCLPLCLQSAVYEGGQYHTISSSSQLFSTMHTQARQGMSAAIGQGSAFMDAYAVLTNLSVMTEVTDQDQDTFLFLDNNTTHEPMLLQEPAYEPAIFVNNRQYDAAHADRFVLDGEELKVEDDTQMIHYQSNMAALIQLGKWFDYLRQEGVYDNTRIILVSDHGKNNAQLEELILDPESPTSVLDMEYYYPLLMVKDFDAEGFATSQEFMTNADVPALAAEGLISQPVNPFTGNAISSDEKYAHDQFVILSENWSVEKNSGNTFAAARWASVRDDMRVGENWKIYDEKLVLTEHAAP